VWVNAYGYNPMAANNVAVSQSQTTTQNFPLTALPVYAVSGHVGDAANPWFIYAKVQALGVPGGIATSDPTDGEYSLPLAQGVYTLRVSSEPGFAPLTQVVTVTQNITGLDFGLAQRNDYACADNRHSGGPTYEWIDARGAYTYTLGDEGTIRLNLPAPFLFYGTQPTSAYASSNGHIVFGANQAGANMVIPFEGLPNNSIYGLVEDLNPANGAQGLILTKTLTINSEQLFVVEWYQVQHWEHGYPETFEVILNLTNNTIKAQYETVSWPDFTTAGIESPLAAGSTYATVYSYANSAGLRDGRAVLYTPVSGKLSNQWDYFGCSLQQLYLPLSMRSP
jgi:hypothetical protein